MKKRRISFWLVCLLIFCFCFPMNVNAASGTWKKDNSGWWYSYSNGSYARGWTMIKGCYYYFDNSGYMAHSEYRDGYWLNSDGSWNSNYQNAHWCHDNVGWWYTDSSGWYPRSQWLKIDGYYYYFKANGYLVTDEEIDGYYVNKDGIYVSNSKKETKEEKKEETKEEASSSSGVSSKNDYSGFNGNSTVYVSQKGKIHKNSNCGGMKRYSTMTYNDAKNAGYSECGTCFK